jgi:ATP-dependent DNA ligase
MATPGSQPGGSKPVSTPLANILNDHKQGERVQVWSRRGADFTYRFPRIAEAVRSLNADRALIDGEAVVLRSDGRSDFVALLTRRGGAQASFVAFDLPTRQKSR